MQLHAMVANNLAMGHLMCIKTTSPPTYFAPMPTNGPEAVVSFACLRKSVSSFASSWSGQRPSGRMTVAASLQNLFL
jgi:hypothetical protein